VWNGLVTLVPGEVMAVIVQSGLIMIPLLAALLIAVRVSVDAHVLLV
jgi:hypothetical protein